MRITLQNRITTMMIVFILTLVSAFAVVQLNNQLHIITVFSSLRARLTAQLFKHNVEEALNAISPADNPQKVLQSAIDSFGNTEFTENALIYSADGTIVAAINAMLIGKKPSSYESVSIDEAWLRVKNDTPFFSRVDEEENCLQLYIPVSNKTASKYTARVDFPLANIAGALREVYMPVILTALIVIITTFIFGLILSKRIVGPVSLLNSATKEVAAGDLNLRIHMNTHDELEELSETFNVMTVELKKMKEKAENANPLTKLPGNIVIREEAEKLLKENKKFVVIYCDLDNFKAFNDKYGIHAGDEAIKLTAAVFKEAVAQKGNANDFIGHEGGDDFILLTTPDKAKDMGDYIISEFAKRIKALYNKEDLDRGYIEAKSRYGNEIMKFPIMTISLAGVTNEIRLISSYAEITNIAAEVKKKAKQTPGSCLFMDKRKDPSPPSEPGTAQ